MYIVKVKFNGGYPSWFTNVVRYVSDIASSNADQYWTTTWNRVFENKIKYNSSDAFEIFFKNEAEFTMFLLRWGK